MAKKRSTRRWWWNHFAEHPGYANKQDTSMVNGKAKVICKVIYEQHIAREQRLDQEQVSTGQRESPRNMSAIVGTLWATAQNDTHHIWLVSRPSTLLFHLCDCELHPNNVRSQAQQEYHNLYSPHKNNCQHMLLPPGIPAQLEPLTLALQSGMHMLPRMPQFPTLSIPTWCLANDSSVSLVAY
ncbi:hypothetical protein PAXRUDRAFT_783759 [Paxillus rubicundulus Ve08.2h10]|uniref:Uncharacterized protein n=1 Tax=Paxillus rubicundulus Ve08.2h10 TaxID=930991 RepID=A0A0D0DQ24_9AGAM|nr:hypothetical protein PAXRUDRAFT_783759 [Paxillus rubicundulus Ve08.2h10]